jgi:putative transcriptional regulator
VSSFHPSSQSLRAGQLLIAAPSLIDGVFDRSVIFLADHTSDGAFGLILNQPSGEKVGDYLKDESFASLSRIPVFSGGPVASEHLTFAAFWRTPQNKLGYSVRISAEEAQQHSRNPGTLVRAFVGYSGWNSGQLESEIENDGWVLSHPPGNLLAMEHGKELWRKILHDMSPFHRLLALCPRHPWLN